MKKITFAELSCTIPWEKIATKKITAEELTDVKTATIEWGKYFPHVKVEFENENRPPHFFLVDMRSPIEFKNGKIVDLTKCLLNTYKKGEEVISKIFIIE